MILDGIRFALDSGLIRLAKLYGQVRIDYQKKRFFGSGFRCRLGYTVSSC
ncbi:MAG TPA: hypothetical protein PLV45_10740 [bacterium]|nr:hypothetical protein [bacterium]